MEHSRKISYGVIADTHGVIPASVHEVFGNVSRIYHCGDIGSEACVDELDLIAPARLVSGNMDPSEVAFKYPDQLIEETEFGVLVMVHGAQYSHRNDAIVPKLLEIFSHINPRVILFGHTHAPMLRPGDGTAPMLLNPGSAGRPKTGQPATAAILEYEPETDHLTARHVELGKR